MAGNRNKAEATERLIALGLAPGFIEEEEGAAYCRMSTASFRKWYRSDPNAPQPFWFGGCKRFKVSELAAGRREELRPALLSSDPIMVAIDAHSTSPVR